MFVYCMNEEDTVCYLGKRKVNYVAGHDNVSSAAIVLVEHQRGNGISREKTCVGTC